MIDVLHLTRDFPPRCTGGISTAVAGLVRASRAAGLDCAVVSFDGWRPQGGSPGAPLPEPSDEQGFRVLRLTSPEQLSAARSFACALSPRLIQVHHDMLWPFAAELRERLKAPALLTVHVVQHVQNQLRGLCGETLSSAAQKKALSECDLAVAPSRAAADRLLEAGLIAPDRLEVAPLGIEDHPRAQAAARGEARQPETALFVGRYADINGMAELADVILMVLARRPEASFVLAGGIPENKKAERRWARRWKERIPPALQERVEHTGWMEQDALSHLYARATLLVSASWFETFGLTVLEGMLHGLPVAGTRSGGVEALVEHGENGLLSAPRDARALAENILYLLENPDAARRIGARGAEQARTRWLWPQVFPRWNALYERLW